MGILGMLIIVLLFWSLFFNYYKLFRSSLDNKIVRSVVLAGTMVVVGVFIREQFNYMLNRELAILFWSVNGMLLGFALRQGDRC
jgi:hypothetical protein